MDWPLFIIINGAPRHLFKTSIQAWKDLSKWMDRLLHAEGHLSTLLMRRFALKPSEEKIPRKNPLTKSKGRVKHPLAWPWTRVQGERDSGSWQNRRGAPWFACAKGERGSWPGGLDSSYLIPDKCLSGPTWSQAPILFNPIHLGWFRLAQIKSFKPNEELVIQHVLAC